MPILTLTMNGHQVSGHDDETLLQIARQHGIHIPTLCQLDGLSDIGACRLCLVEIEGQDKLVAACVTKPQEGMSVRTDSERLKRHRRTIVELLASEGNHQCAVCVVNEHCQLQDLAYEMGLQNVRFPYLFPKRTLDATHKDFVMDRNRCVLCSRCIRVCHEVEGAHTWDTAGRSFHCTIIADMDEPWGTAASCTSCGKCVWVCPTGALFEKGQTVAEMEKHRDFLKYIVTARRTGEWIAEEEGE